MLMEFNFVDGTHFATNSIKPVSITKFDDECYSLFMSKGNINHDLPSHMFFETFEEAVKTAEHFVGVQLELEDA